MDTEKYNEMQEKISTGKPVTDEGPYYHHVQWEGYKGWSKGAFGGAIIGTLIGGLVGVAAGAAVFFALPATVTAVAAIGAAVATTTAFAGIGLYKGMEKFGDIVSVAGAVSAGLDTAERRNKYNLDKVALEIKAELGNKEAAQELENLKDPAYRTTHYIEPQDSSQEQGVVFWKVAVVGLLVGVASGLLLGFGGVATGIFAKILPHAAAEALGTNGIVALSAATFGAFGASFGINRDIFRKVFDVTDVLYRGKVADQSPSVMVTRSKEKSVEKMAEQQAPVAYIPAPSYPASDNHFRDAEIAKAQKAMMEMDISSMRAH